MPTPGGKPKIGEFILDRHGKPIYEVKRRTDGDQYSVWGKVLDPGERNYGQVQIITEFEWWRSHNDWRVVPADQVKQQLADEERTKLRDDMQAQIVHRFEGMGQAWPGGDHLASVAADAALGVLVDRGMV